MRHLPRRSASMRRAGWTRFAGWRSPRLVRGSITLPRATETREASVLKLLQHRALEVVDARFESARALADVDERHVRPDRHAPFILEAATFELEHDADR